MKGYYHEHFEFELIGNEPFVTCVCGERFLFTRHQNNHKGSLLPFAHCPRCNERWHCEKDIIPGKISLIRTRTNRQIHLDY